MRKTILSLIFFKDVLKSAKIGKNRTFPKISDKKVYHWHWKLSSTSRTQFAEKNWASLAFGLSFSSSRETCKKLKFEILKLLEMHWTCQFYHHHVILYHIILSFWLLGGAYAPRRAPPSADGPQKIDWQKHQSGQFKIAVLKSMQS